MTDIHRPLPRPVTDWHGSSFADRISIYQQSAYDPIYRIHLGDGDDLVEVEWNAGVSRINGGAGADLVKIVHYQKRAYTVKKTDTGYKIAGPELDLDLVDVEFLVLNEKYFDLRAAVFDSNGHLELQQFKIPKGTSRATVEGTTNADLVSVESLYSTIRLGNGDDLLLIQEGLAFAEFGNGEDTLELNGPATNYVIRKFDESYLVSGKNLQIHASDLEKVAFRGTEIASTVLDLRSAVFDAHGAVDYAQSTFENGHSTSVLSGTDQDEVFTLGTGKVVIDAGEGIDVLRLMVDDKVSVKMTSEGSVLLKSQNATASLKGVEYLNVSFEDGCSKSWRITEDDFDHTGAYMPFLTGDWFI